MDIVSTVIGLVCLAIFTVPVIYITLKQNSKKKKFLKFFLLLAERRQLKITEYEIWGRFFGIGIDQKSNQLFYLKKRYEQVEEKTIDLSQLSRCTIENISNNASDGHMIDRLELKCMFRNSRFPESLQFYNREENMSLLDELRIIKKWEARINLSLKRKSS